ncbi:MAG: VIT domain-containing protein [Myxococcota bacterium]
MVVLIGIVAALASRGLPVREISYDVDVSHAIAEATFTQVFVNDQERFIEGVYTFPLPENAAVDGLEIEVEGRTIIGRIEKRAEARRAYRRAVAEGRVAALTEESRPNVFTQRVGNVPPGGTIRVTLRLVQPIPRVEGQHELVLPLVAAPRFVPQTASRSLEVGPLVGGPPLQATIHLDVASAFAIQSLTSSTHVVMPHIRQPERIGEPHRASVTLEAAANRDVVLRWTTSRPEPQAGLLIQDGHALISVEPPSVVPTSNLLPRELVWLVDQSCSMQGAPLDLTQRAMRRMIDQLDERDSLWLLPSSNWLASGRQAVPMTPWARTLADGVIASLEASGPTPLLEGVRTVLGAPLDPGRERTVVIVTDGLVANDLEVLAATDELLGSQRLFTIGPGPAPNRFLLEELARITGGSATFLRVGEDLGTTVDRFLRTIEKPVLTDVTIDWGDWQVDSPTPQRLPAVYADRPLQIAVRVLSQGTTPILLQGRSGDGSFQVAMHPTVLPSGRALPSTWARGRIRELDRNQQWRNIGDVTRQITDLSLEYQVSSRYTSFIAIDSAVVRQVADVDGVFRAEQRVAPPEGARFFQAEKKTRSQVGAKEFLTKIPAGRSYQNSINIAAGVQPGVGGNVAVGGAFNENTYSLDGVNVTDPVTGTFGVNFNFDALTKTPNFVRGVLPNRAGHAPAPLHFVPGGTNNLSFHSEWLHVETLAGNSVRADSLWTELSGPIVRDQLWALARHRMDVTANGGRTFHGHQAHAGLTLQPNAEHRLNLSSHLNTAEVVDAGERSPQQQSQVSGTYWWFPDAKITLATHASAERIHVDGDTRLRETARSELSVFEVRGPWGGDHDFAGGVDVERVRWSLGPTTQERLGPTVPSLTSLPRLGLFLQDDYKRSRVRILGGLRGDVALGQLYLGPRAWFRWEPFGDQRTWVDLGFARSFGTVVLPQLAATPDLGPSRMDETTLGIESEIAPNWSVGSRAAYRQRCQAPNFWSSPNVSVTPLVGGWGCLWTAGVR